jgi:hypothetical protein
MGGERYKRFSAYERLSDAGKAVLAEAVEQDWTIEQTHRALFDATQEVIANGSLGRWIKFQRDLRELEIFSGKQIKGWIEAVGEQNPEAIELLEAMAKDGLANQLSTLRAADPKLLTATVLKIEGLRLQKRALDQKDAELARLQADLELKRQKTEALAARAKEMREQAAAAQKAVSNSKDLTDEQKRKIKDLYGLLDEVEKAA